MLGSIAVKFVARALKNKQHHRCRWLRGPTLNHIRTGAQPISLVAHDMAFFQNARWHIMNSDYKSGIRGYWGIELTQLAVLA